MKAIFLKSAAPGERGATGEKGSTGEKGATGERGLAGENGATGATGELGAPGTNGSNGADGPSGATGVTGANGATGTTGATGPPGEVQLITCERTKGTRGRPVQSCTSSPSSSPIKFTSAGLKIAASLSRGKITFATGFAIGLGARTRLMLSPLRRITKGRYTLTLKRDGRQSRQTILIE